MEILNTVEPRYISRLFGYFLCFTALSNVQIKFAYRKCLSYTIHIVWSALFFKIHFEFALKLHSKTLSK